VVGSSQLLALAIACRGVYAAMRPIRFRPDANTFAFVGFSLPTSSPGCDPDLQRHLGWLPFVYRTIYPHRLALDFGISSSDHAVAVLGLFQAASYAICALRGAT